MDPDEALTEIRDCIAEMEEWPSGSVPPAVDALIEHVKALDEWLSNRGFVPSAWSYPDSQRTAHPTTS